MASPHILARQQNNKLLIVIDLKYSSDRQTDTIKTLMSDLMYSSDRQTNQIKSLIDEIIWVSFPRTGKMAVSCPFFLKSRALVRQNLIS